MATTDPTTGLDHPTVVPENFDPDGDGRPADGDESTADGGPAGPTERSDDE